MLCLIPVYLVIGVLNTIANHKNYNIHLYRDVNPNYDVRVRRDTNMDDAKHNDAAGDIILNFLVESFKDRTSPNVMVKDQGTLESDEYVSVENNVESDDGNRIKQPMNAYELIKRTSPSATTHPRVERHVSFRTEIKSDITNVENRNYNTKTPVYGNNNGIYSNSNGIYVAKPAIYSSNSYKNNGVYDTITAVYPSNDGMYRNNNHNGVYGSNSGVYSNSNNGIYGSNSGVYGTKTPVHGSNNGIYGSNSNNNGVYDTKTPVYGSNSGVYSNSNNNGVYDTKAAVYDGNNGIYDSEIEMETTTEMNIQRGCILFCGTNRCPSGKEWAGGFCIKTQRRTRKRT